MSMKFQPSNLLAILLTIFVCSANAADAQKSRAYDDAQALGACAGMLEFNSQLQSVMKNSINAEELHQKATGWKIATIGALSQAGWKDEIIFSAADSIYIGAITHWQAALERQDPNLGKDLQDAVANCLKINTKQEYYRKEIKQKIFAK